MSQRQHNVAYREPVGLTFEDLKSFRYVQPIFNKFNELKKENPNMTWDDPEFMRARNFIFDGMDDREQTAYVFTFGYPNFEVLEQNPSAADTSDVEDVSATFFKDFLWYSSRYGSTEKISLIFDNEGMTDENIENRYHRPFLEQEGANIVGANVRFPEDTTGVAVEGKASAEEALAVSVHSHIRTIVLSVLKKTEIRQGLTEGVFSFLKGKGIFQPLEGELDFIFKPRYYAYGGTFLDGAGLNANLVVCYRAQLDGEQYGVMGVTALGEVKGPSIKRYFGLMQRSLRNRDQEFLDAIAIRMTQETNPSLGLGNQEFLHALADRMTWDDTPAAGLGEDLQAAVELYLIITKLVTSAVHIGVPRVMLMDSVDFLLIELDENFQLEDSIHTSLQFPKLVSCQHRWLSKSDFFLRLTICSFLSPTLQYTKTLARFRSVVQKSLLTSITELLRSVAENLRRIPPRMKTTEYRGETGSTTGKREGGTELETLSALRAKVVEAMAEAEIMQLSPTTPEAQDDSSFGAASSNDTVFSDYTTSADTTISTSAPSPLNIEGKMMYPEEYRDTTYGVEFCDNRTFSVRYDTFKYPFYVNLEKAVKRYVKSDQGLISQVSLVNPDAFLAYIPQPFMFNNAPAAESAILKVYDPFWYNNDSYSDPEVAFHKLGPQLQELCKNELLVYGKIVTLMGEVVPLIYSYGYMIDVSIMVGQSYKKFIGPYILMQQFERSKRFKECDVDLEFVQTRIIPQFNRLHELEVVHNDFKWENMLVTEDRNVKIIDFSHSFISSNENDYREDIDKIYDYFGYPNPGSG